MFDFYFRLTNLKDANECQIAGSTEKLAALLPHVMEEIKNLNGDGNNLQVKRIVRKGHIYFSKAYTRMVKRNACTLLFQNGKVGETEFFVWNKSSGETLVAYREVESRCRMSRP